VQHLGRIAPRECKVVSGSAVIASEAKQSMEQQAGKLDCFASLAMTVVAV
jgi:hypothetical protein